MSNVGAEVAIKKRLLEVRAGGGLKDAWEAVHVEQAIRCLRPQDSPASVEHALDKSRQRPSERSSEDAAEFKLIYANYKPKTISELEELLVQAISASP